MSAPVAPAATVPPRPRARRSLSRWIFALVYTVGVVLATAVALLIGWINSADFQRRAVGLAEALVEDATGEQCTVTRVQPRFWPPGLDVDGFHLYHEVTGDTIVSVERLRVPLVLRDGGVAIGRLTLQRPVVQLHLGEEGKLREFRSMRRSADGARKPLERLLWSSVALSDGAFRITHPEGHLAIEHIDFVPVDGPITDVTADLEVVVRGLREQTRLTLPGVVLGPDVLEIPALVVDTDLIALRGRARWPLGADLDVDLSARVVLEEINPLLVPPRKAHGFLDVDLRLAGPPADPTAEINAWGRQLGIDMPGVFQPLLTYELGDATAAVVATREAVRIEKASLFWEGGTLSAWGTITRDKRLHDGHVVGDRVSLEHLLQAFDAAPTPWIDMNADLEVVWEGTLDPLRLEGDFDLAVSTLQLGDRPISAPGVQLMLDIPRAHARGGILLEKDHVVLTSNDVRSPRNHGSVRVDIGFGPRGPLDLRAELAGADLRDFQPLNGVELTGVGRIAGRFWGPFNRLQFLGEGDVRDFSVMGIPYADHLVAELRSPEMKTIELRHADARRLSSKYRGWFRMDFRPPVAMDTEVEVTEGRIEDVVSMFVDLPGMTGDLTGTMSLHGPLYELDGEAHLQLADVDLWGERFETGWGHGYLDNGLFTLDDLTVHRFDATEGVTLRGSVERQWALDMEVYADGLGLERLDSLRDAELPLSGNVAAYAHVTNTLFDPSPDGRLSIADVRYAGHPIEDSFVVFDTTDGVMEFAALAFGSTAAIDGTLGLWGQQPYQLTADLDQLPAHMFYPIAADGQPLRAVVSGDLTLSGHFGMEWSPASLWSRLDEVEVRYAEHTLANTSPWIYTQDGSRYALEDFGLSGGGTHLELNARGGGPSGLELEGGGQVDLGLIGALVPGVERSSGTADVTIYAAGTRPHVEAVVDVDIDAELFRYATVPVTFEDFEASARITDTRIVIESLTSKLGGGTLTGGGAIEAQDWIPTRFDLSAQIEDAQVQWVESLPPAIGDASFRFDGPADALLLHGDVVVNDMTFSDRIDWEDWVVEYRNEMLVDPATSYDEEPWFNLSVHMVADRTIHLRNNVAEGNASADLRLIGDTARPGLVGNVRINEALAFLQDREFQVDRGNLLFNDPWTWDPDLDIDLITDIEANDQRYRVSYLVLGPFSHWRSESRSEPPLAQSDVNALLWFGVTTEDLEEMGELSSAVAQGVADMILTDFLITNQAGELAEEIPRALLFDRIDLATGVNGRGEYTSEPRLLVEKSFPELDTDVRWEFNLVRPEDNFVRADKRIGGIWSLSGWYTSLPLERVLLGGAWGLDVTARWESD